MDIYPLFWIYYCGAMLVEVSFEVGNKVGGIYTVLKTKLHEMISHYKGQYLAIGFYNPSKSMFDFMPEPIKGIDFDIGCNYVTGKWLGANAVLVDPGNEMEKANEVKTELWEKYRIDSIRAGRDFDEPVVWGWCVAKLINEMKKRGMLRDAVAHYHEWLSGSALLYSDVPSVFTTHATVMGRTLAGNGVDIYSMKSFDESLAWKYGVEAKHLMEKAAANHADVFTTVSEITAREARMFLGRKPDVIVPNGINVSAYPSMEELGYLHKERKKKLMKFIAAYFGPYGKIDFDDPRIFFISGRYEFRNKGVDIFIKALGELERRLEKEGSSRDVFVFFLIPSSVRAEKKDVLENVMMSNEIEEFIESTREEIGDAMFRRFVNGSNPSKACSDAMRKYRSRIAGLQRMFSKTGKAPLSAFDLTYPESSDLIISSLLENGLDNAPERKVKVVFYPVYISPADRLLEVDSYTEFVQACSAGIFPSYYEPWGYTPVEAAINGVVAVTSSLSGFGQWLKRHGAEGISVVDRSSDDKAIKELADILFKLSTISKNEIGFWKTKCRRDAEKVDWKKLVAQYFRAHEMARQKK